MKNFERVIFITDFAENLKLDYIDYILDKNGEDRGLLNLCMYQEAIH